MNRSLLLSLLALCLLFIPNKADAQTAVYNVENHERRCSEHGRCVIDCAVTYGGDYQNVRACQRSCWTRSGVSSDACANYREMTEEEKRAYEKQQELEKAVREERLQRWQADLAAAEALYAEASLMVAASEERYGLYPEQHSFQDDPILVLLKKAKSLVTTDTDGDGKVMPEEMRADLAAKLLPLKKEAKRLSDEAAYQAFVAPGPGKRLEMVRVSCGKDSRRSSSSPGTIFTVRASTSGENGIVKLVAKDTSGSVVINKTLKSKYGDRSEHSYTGIGGSRSRFAVPLGQDDTYRDEIATSDSSGKYKSNPAYVPCATNLNITVSLIAPTGRGEVWDSAELKYRTHSVRYKLRATRK